MNDRPCHIFPGSRPTTALIAGALVLAVASLASAAGASGDASGAGEVRKGAAITIPAKIELAAPSAKVWSVLTSAQGFGSLTGFKIEDAKHVFSKLGDSAAASIWSDKGRLVVTGFEAGKELRVTWEPESASYLCAKRMVLSSSGGKTVLEYWDRYTDDQPNADATAKQVRDETVKAIAAFKTLVEK